MAGLQLTEEQREYIVGLERNGRLSAMELVEDARDPGSPLHPLFTWDDERAAQEYRLEQARTVIRSVQVQVERRSVMVAAPRYVKDPSRPGNHAGYMSMETVQDDNALAVLAVVAELNRCLGYLRRAEKIAGVLDQAPEVTGIIAAVERLRDDMQHGQAEEHSEAA